MLQTLTKNERKACSCPPKDTSLREGSQGWDGWATSNPVLRIAHPELKRRQIADQRHPDARCGRGRVPEGSRQK